jgi:hypothetical protein
MDRTPRLAELVIHLTGCPPRVAVDAVAASTVIAPRTADEALAVVARAMCSVRHLDLTDSVDLREPTDLRAPAEVRAL